MKITVIGTGAYSVGIALMLAKKKENNIMLWTENKQYVKEFNETRKLVNIFKDVTFPGNISITNSYEEALNNTGLIFMITSAKYILEVCNNILPFYKKTPICIASKGIHHETKSCLSELVKNTLKTKNVCIISGPTFAIDLVNNEPAALAIAGYNDKTIKLVQDNLANETLKLRKSKDIIGVQLCGSVKNIIAIAAGILKGLNYSESTQAFLINESLHDMKHIIYALGGNKKTILSFAGIGDLLLTCSSIKSRNYSFGVIIGKNATKKEINDYLKNNTVEGYYTLNSIQKMLEKKGIVIPLINLIQDIVSHKRQPKDLANFLITKA